MAVPVAGGGVFNTQRPLRAQRFATVGVIKTEGVALSDFAAGREHLDDLVALALDVRQDANGQAKASAAHRQ